MIRVPIAIGAHNPEKLTFREPNQNVNICEILKNSLLLLLLGPWNTSATVFAKKTSSPYPILPSVTRRIITIETVTVKSNTESSEGEKANASITK